MLRGVGTAVVVNPDPPLLAIARQEDWRVMRFEKLGRRVAIVGATAVAAAVGGSSRAIAKRHSERRRFHRMRDPQKLTLRR